MLAVLFGDKRGHAYSGDNLMVEKGTGKRKCRACHNARHRAYRARAVADLSPVSS